MTKGPEAVDRYNKECRGLGFDVVEISTGFITILTDDRLCLLEKVQKAGLKAKPEAGIQFGAGRDSAAGVLKAEGTLDVEWMIEGARCVLDAGAYTKMVESEGITDNVKLWRTNVTARITTSLGLDEVTFEAVEPEVFAWYIKNYGPEMTLFADRSQIFWRTLRHGIWGVSSRWGRVLTYKGLEEGSTQHAAVWTPV